MYEKIVVPLDGSKLAELALPYAEWLAAAFGSELVLLSVCERSEREYRETQQLCLERIAAAVRKNIEKRAAAEVKAVLLFGDPAKEIVSYAERNNVSLIAMASHGRSGIMMWALGSVANKVLQRASVPVLLIKVKGCPAATGTEKTINKVLIPLDGSELGEAALPHVRELANKIPVEVILFQVVERGMYVHTVGGLNYVPFKEPVLESMKKRAEEYLKKTGEKLTSTKATIRREVRTGDVAEEIIKYADEANVNLIAMSTHGYSGVKEWIMGGVAHKVLQAANKPMLLVRAPGTRL